MIRILVIALVVWLIGAWYIILSSTKRCPHCGGKMDRAGNNYICKECHKFWHMNMFGKFTEETNMMNINPETHVCDGHQPKNGDTIVELFGRRLKIVSDATYVTCNHCALADICEDVYSDYDTKPCEKANGLYNQHFEEDK